MKFLYLFGLTFAAPVSSNATTEMSPAPTSTTSPMVPIEIKNDVDNMGIHGNAANRDQTNSIVSQENKAEKQLIIGSQTDSHDITAVNNTSFTNNNSNTTVFNHDDHVSNQYSNQQTFNNHHQNVQNVYQIQEKIVQETVRHEPVVAYGGVAFGGAVSETIVGATQNRVQNEATPDANVKKVPVELFREIVKNAKTNSDLAYELALELLSK